MAEILVCDDDKDIVEAIEIYLAQEGHHILKAYDGEQAIRVLQNNPVDLLIIDVMMPKIDGIEMCRRIRECRNIPIIILSAKSADVDKILGLSVGADDYMIKPFNPMELLARVKSQLRRYLELNPGVLADSNTIEVQDVVIDTKKHRVTVDGRDVVLTPIEFSILQLLASHPGRVFSTDEIYENVWNEKLYEANNTVMVHMRRLREKVEKSPRSPQLIKTVWGVGYKIEG